ncbi:hypothetical protein DRO32_03760, partial [Candidatus Bathyarchaeota archaeon]
MDPRLLVGIAGLIVGLVSLAITMTRTLSAFKRIGRFLTSKELGREPLRPEVVEVIIQELLRSREAWNPSFLWTHRAEDVKGLLTKHKKVLVLGEAGVCKSRTALEVLRALSRSKVLRRALVVLVRSDREVNGLPVPKWYLKLMRYGQVVLFFDDLDRYVVAGVDISGLIKAFEEAAGELWVVATCRTEQFDLIKEKVGAIFW